MATRSRALPAPAAKRKSVSLAAWVLYVNDLFRLLARCVCVCMRVRVCVCVRERVLEVRFVCGVYDVGTDAR